MAIPNSERYNLVILPLTADDVRPERFELSAGRLDRQGRLVSSPWTAAQIRLALDRAGVPPWQVEQLFRGNRMVFGGGDSRTLSFTKEELLAMGLAPDVATDR